jgi:hypothetical protein
MTAHAEIVRNGAGEPQGILLRAHAEHPVSIDSPGEDLNGQFDRIADHDKQGLRQAHGAGFGDALKNW